MVSVTQKWFRFYTKFCSPSEVFSEFFWERMQKKEQVAEKLQSYSVSGSYDFLCELRQVI